MTLLLALLCGTVQAADPEPVATTPATGGEADAPAEEAEAPAEEAAPVPVTKTYAMRQVFTSQMRNPNPFSNKEWKSTHTHTWALVKWTQEGEKVRYAEDTCGVYTEPVFGAETIYTDAFIDGVPLRKRTATLRGQRFMAGPYVQDFGVDLKDPYNDPLPTSLDDPRLSDDDKDGHPGVTVRIQHSFVGKGEVYIAQRSVARLEGQLHEDGTLTGVVFTSPDMAKLDADRWWLRGETPQRPHPDPAKSPWIMVPVADGFTCDQVVAQQATLFPTVKPEDD